MRRALIALIALITAVGILITEENWRGKRAFENYKREAEKKGERFDLADLIPAPVPDDENFFKDSFVARILNPSPNLANNAGLADREEFNIFRGDSENWPTRDGSWQKGNVTDLEEWQQYFRKLANSASTKADAFPVPTKPGLPAVDVLRGLSSFDAAVEKLHAAALRPYARLPLNYESGFEVVGEMLPSLAGIKRYGTFLKLRTVAELQNGESKKALADVRLLLRLTDSLRNQPFVISHLVRLAMVSLTIQPIYEGLAQHRWSDDQLVELDRQLAQLDFLADYRFAMRGERAFAIDSLERQRITREQKIVDDSSGTNRVITVSFRFTPSAFFYQNELAFARLHEQFALPLVDLDARIVSPSAARKATTAVQEQTKHYSPYRMIALMTFTGVNRSVIRFAVGQNSADLARVACALERYFLAHGNYPESLELLAPQFIEKLPHDIINGQPLKYRRGTNGRYILYSVGWNETDDGGVRGTGKHGWENGDWVWQLPAQ